MAKLGKWHAGVVFAPPTPYPAAAAGGGGGGGFAALVNRAVDQRVNAVQLRAMGAPAGAWCGSKHAATMHTAAVALPPTPTRPARPSRPAAAAAAGGWQRRTAVP
eukprot:gene41141-43978_t